MKANSRIVLWSILSFGIYLLISLSTGTFYLNLENAFLFDKIAWSSSQEPNFIQPLLFTKPFFPLVVYLIPQLLLGTIGYSVLNGLIVSGLFTYVMYQSKGSSSKNAWFLVALILNPMLLYIFFLGGISFLAALAFLGLMYFLSKFLIHSKARDLSIAGFVAAVFMLSLPSAWIILLAFLPLILWSSLTSTVKELNTGPGWNEQKRRGKAFLILLTSNLTAFYSLPLLLGILSLALNSYGEDKEQFQLSYNELHQHRAQLSWYIKLFLALGLNIASFLLLSINKLKTETKASFWLMNLFLLVSIIVWPYGSVFVFIMPSIFSFVFLSLVKERLRLSKRAVYILLIGIIVNLTFLIDIRASFTKTADSFSHNSVVLEKEEVERIDLFFKNQVPKSKGVVLNPDYLFQLSPLLEDSYDLSRYKELSLNTDYVIFYLGDPNFLGLSNEYEGSKRLAPKQIKLGSTAVLKLVFLSENTGVYELVNANYS